MPKYIKTLHFWAELSEEEKYKICAKEENFELCIEHTLEMP